MDYDNEVTESDKVSEGRINPRYMDENLPGWTAAYYAEVMSLQMEGDLYRLHEDCTEMYNIDIIV